MNTKTLALLLLCAVWGADACETVLAAAEIVADRTRAVEFIGPSAAAELGWTVSSAGDVNGDGRADFAISAPFDGSNHEGAVFLVFGRRTGAWENADFNFSAASGGSSNWIKISGANGIYLGKSGLSFGDFNGDGFSDVLIGSNIDSFCVFGHSGRWNSFSIEDLGTGTAYGFALVGGTLGKPVGSAGDMDGDGIEDILVKSGGFGFAHVVFGKEGMTRGNVTLSKLDGVVGFSLVDGTLMPGQGAIGSAGDVNGDGLSDLAIGSYTANDNAGRAFVLFARDVRATGQQWTASFNLSTDIDGTNGFIVEGTASSMLGETVVGAGDVNGDGFADVFISYDAGIHLLCGNAGPWQSSFSVSQINGTNGFSFASSPSEQWGYAGGGAGDINGDGFDDIIIGGWNAPNSSGSITGAAAIILGRAGPWPEEIGTSDIVGSMGFLIDGPPFQSRFGFAAKTAGDVNGDGFADIIVGAYYYNDLQAIAAGYALLVFGTPDDHCAVCSNTTNACLVCDDGFILNGTVCKENVSSSISSSSSSSIGPSSAVSSTTSFSSSAVDNGATVVVIIHFKENISDPTELEEEIASVLGIDSGLVSVVVISPTEVEVTIIGSEEAAQHLVDVVNNGGEGSDGSCVGILCKATDAHIRKDTSASSGNGGGGGGDDDTGAASKMEATALFACTIVSLLLK